MRLRLQQVVLQVYPQADHAGRPLHSRGADNRAEPFENTLNLHIVPTRLRTHRCDRCDLWQRYLGAEPV